MLYPSEHASQFLSLSLSLIMTDNLLVCDSQKIVFIQYEIFHLKVIKTNILNHHNTCIVVYAVCTGLGKSHASGH